MESESLSSLLANIFLCRDAAEICIWNSDSAGLFSSRSFYREIDPFSAVQSPCASIWMGLVPPRVKAFCWLVVAGNISTADLLRRRGLLLKAISETCCMCRREVMAIDHLFIHCNVSSSIWRHFLKSM